MPDCTPGMYAILAGFASRFIFSRWEPTIIRFLVLLLSLFSLLVSISFLGHAKQSFMSNVIIPTFNFLAGLSVSVVIYRLSPWHPLAQYPGPVLARLSKWWMAYWIGKGNRHSLIQQLHAQYGPWLRIGPNEISVAHSAAIRPIYGKMFRAPFYQGAPQDADALITTLDQAEHATRLVAWQKAFTTDSLRNFRSFLLARTEQLLECLHRESSQGKMIDFSHWIGLWAMDVMGDMSFSGGFETMAAGRDEEGWMEVLQIGVLFVGILGQVPWMKDLIALLPQPTPIITFHQFASKKVHETKARDNGARQDILGIIQDEGSGGPPLSAQQATADASFMVVAGSDTVSQAVTALFRRIAGDPKIQDRLRLEIDSAFARNSDIDSFTLSKLPYLDACIQETLRLIPPVAAGPPRYSGAQGCQVLDKYIPPGTTVACLIYTLHRDSRNFKDPDLFQPERWLSGSLGGPHNVEAFFPFGYGHGVCIGKPVALHNMKFITVRLLQTFGLSFSKGFDPRKFDLSYKEHNLWWHDPLLLDLTSI